MNYSTDGSHRTGSRFLPFRLKRFEGKPCPYCRRPMMRAKSHLAARAPSRDHMTPRSRGGTDDPSNILVCCRACNEDKGSLDHVEYLAVLAGTATRIDRHMQRLIALLPTGSDKDQIPFFWPKKEQTPR